MRRLLWWALCAGGLGLLAGCDQTPTLAGAQEGGGGEVDVEVLTVSPTWQAGADAGTVDDRIAELTAAIRDLRDTTGSGWVGRQDDVTGWLGELRGGRYQSSDGGGPSATAAAFLDQWGPDLFGVTAQGIDFTPQGAPDPSGSVVLRGLQHVGEVPVVDGVLTVTVADAQTDPRISALRGRVFAGLDVDTTPTLDETAAAQAAVEGGQAAGGGEVQGEPTLVVYPRAGGADNRAALAWQVTVVGGGPAGGQDDSGFRVDLVYVDAEDGTIIATRPASFDVGHARGAPVGTLAQIEEVPEGESVEVTGEGPLGDELTATGLQTDDGSVVLRDTTTETYDSSTGLGGTVTHDGDGLDEADLPGSAATFDSTEVSDPDALAAHAFSRYIMDYYTQVFGRNSWDGAGGTLTSVVNHGPDDFCNAFFSSQFQPPLMVYGNPCIVDGDQKWVTMVDPDVAAHEVTHGVNATSANLLYSGQSGALNESFSDYFGNVIGDHWRGRDSTGMGEDLCEIENRDPGFCVTTDEGDSGLRDVLNGNGLSDYLGLLDPSLLLKVLGFKNDNGGVHLNSAIWNNALFSIRTRLAQIDGTNGRESVRARNFDQAVYSTLAQRLGPTSGFLESAAALEESAVALGLDPESIEIIRETLLLNDLCSDCRDTQATGEELFVGPGGQKQPVISGDRTAWLDFQESENIARLVVDDGTGAAPVAGADAVFAADFAGDALVAHEFTGGGEAIVRHDLESGEAEVLAAGSFLPAIGGSEEGAAWLGVTGVVGYVDQDGTVTEVSLASVGEGLVASIGAGDGTVVLGTDGGEVVVWEVGSDPVVLETIPDATILAVAANGPSVVAAVRYGPLDGPAAGSEVIAYDLSTGDRSVLAQDDILFYGIAVSDEHVAWPAVVGTLPGGVNETTGGAYVDSDLHVYSFATGEVEIVVEQPGQQGYADVAGDRLVWQDAVNGGDDLYTRDLP